MDYLKDVGIGEQLVIFQGLHTYGFQVFALDADSFGSTEVGL